MLHDSARHKFTINNNNNNNTKFIKRHNAVRGLYTEATQTISPNEAA